MNKTLIAITAVLNICAFSSSAIADTRLEPGTFIDLSAGAAGIDIEPIGLVEDKDSEHDKTAWKVNAGYWFSSHWGVSANYVELGDFSQEYGSGTFRGSARSYGVSVLGRLPIGQSWSLIGKVNLTRTEMDDNGSTGGGGKFNDLTGDETNLVLPGVEVHYHVNENASIFLELDPRGKGAEKADVGYAGIGARWSF